MVGFEMIPLIVGAATSPGGTAVQNPVDSVGIASIIAGMLVFSFFAITISINNYRRRKENEARVAEWERSEQERKKRFREEMSLPETK